MSEQEPTDPSPGIGFRCQQLIKFLFNHLQDEGLSDHFQHPDQQQLDFAPHPSILTGVVRFPHGSEGEYLDRDEV